MHFTSYLGKKKKVLLYFLSFEKHYKTNHNKHQLSYIILSDDKIVRRQYVT